MSIGCIRTQTTQTTPKSALNSRPHNSDASLLFVADSPNSQQALTKRTDTDRFPVTLAKTSSKRTVLLNRNTATSRPIVSAHRKRNHKGNTLNLSTALTTLVCLLTSSTACAEPDKPSLPNLLIHENVAPLLSARELETRAPTDTIVSLQHTDAGCASPGNLPTQIAALNSSPTNNLVVDADAQCTWEEVHRVLSTLASGLNRSSIQDELDVYVDEQGNLYTSTLFFYGSATCNKEEQACKIGLHLNYPPASAGAIFIPTSAETNYAVTRRLQRMHDRRIDLSLSASAKWEEVLKLAIIGRAAGAERMSLLPPT